ncbi:unnamed protein product, partial [Discosporangium mesarthrocarpum]
AVFSSTSGTGKTFIGAFLVQTLLAATDVKVMCVYTNHSLDSFLEELLSKGMTSMVRIGGKSKSTKLEPFNIRSKSSGG